MTATQRDPKIMIMLIKTISIDDPVDDAIIVTLGSGFADGV